MALVYCVEDDEGIRELIAAALQSGGHEPVTFPGGEEFLEALKERLPELVLLDIMLPGEDGIVLLKKLRSEAKFKGLPIIMLTAKSSELDKVSGLESGADDYITKPFGVMELLSRIKALMRRTAKVDEVPAIIMGELRLEPAKRQVFCSEKELVLTYKEFELLSLLIKNAGIVISREKALERVWGYDFEGGTRTVDMHIKTLRQKLEETGPGTGALIETVRGVGYRFSNRR